MAQCTCRVSPPQQTRLHTNTRMHICCPAPPDTLLFVCVVNVGHKCVCAFVFTVLYVVMMDTQCAMGVS